MVYLIHLKNFNPKYQYSWISNETIAKKMDRSSRSIGNSVSKLMELGYIYRYEPSEAERKKNGGLHDSYCTRPLVRMLTSKEPIIDEREEYKERILDEIRKKQLAADYREFKKSQKNRSKNQNGKVEGRELPETRPNGEFFEDGLPF
jgi:predicted transcriptional regulator